ncbi:hemoglobin/transferrin/lactoferrin receptor protein [Salinimicrobium catena]|uniref:Hemoglobin/transferrin/lactoferrin receptor protein n=1 Tax=Salinimicrobium catena TaxID=390640 RepID=A0A1H5J4F1_9FLAO|nr:TonB-dependent receptor [Salinimicrobium catena]SDK84095.1 hemoglobin/transferrin/lactoferrin receptor protein [Salinimicrobium catena]SEE47423.1 hemoglobin/transferrin/lactoferrin receptor protein [Salinimicrobium catena]
MRLKITFILLFLTTTIAWSQEITVLDSESGDPIFNVAIFNRDKTKSTLTNFDGKANISAFSEGEILFFRHVSHREFHATKKQLKLKKNLVLLEPQDLTLDEVVLSVAGFEQKKKDLVQKVVTLNQKDIITSSPQTAADLMEKSGQVYVQKSQLGGGSPMIRGFATNRLLITVDGVRMNTAIFRGGNVQNIISIDPLAIEKTEIIIGPGSVVYGSDAIGGVMNFYTLNPAYSLKKDGSLSGKAYGRYATANEEKTGHFDVAYGKEDWALLTSLSYSDFGDMKMGSHGPEEYLRPEYVVRRDGQDVVVENDDPKVQVPTGYDQVNFLQKVRYRPTQDWDLNLGVIYTTTSDYPRYDRLYRKRDGQLRAGEWYYGPQRWLQTNFQVNKLGDGSFYDEAKLTAAYQFFEEGRNDRDFGKETLFETDEHVDAWSANLDFKKELFGSKFHYGLEYVLNEVNSEGKETNVVNGSSVSGSSRYPDDSRWQSMAAYGSLFWKLSPDLSLNTGARYNHVLLNATFDEDVYDFPFSDADINTGALTGSAGLNWQQNKVIGWQLNLSTAFRAPNIDDVGKIFDSAPGMVVVPNPDLKPETAYNAELGTRLNFSKVVQLEVAGYYTYLDDAMVRRDYSLDGETVIDYHGEPSRVQAIQNAAHARVYGIEAGTKVKFSEKLKFTSQISLTEGEEEQDDGSTAPLRHAAPFFGRAHLVWENEKLRLDLFTVYNGEIAYEDLAPSEQDKGYLYAVDENGNPYSPEWYTLNFTTQYQLGDDWLATASIENITDQRYRTYSSGIAAAGRNLIVALQYSF